MTMAAGRWECEASAAAAVLAVAFARRGGGATRNPYRPAPRRTAAPDPAAARVSADLKWAMFEQGMRDHARKVARFKAAQQPQEGG